MEEPGQRLRRALAQVPHKSWASHGSSGLKQPDHNLTKNKQTNILRVAHSTTHCAQRAVLSNSNYGEGGWRKQQAYFDHFFINISNANSVV